MLTNRKSYRLWDIVPFFFRLSPSVTLLYIVIILLRSLVPTFIILSSSFFIAQAILYAEGQPAKSQINLSLTLLLSVIAFNWFSEQLQSLIMARLRLQACKVLLPEFTERRAQLKYPLIEDSETYNLISRVADSPERVYPDIFSNIMNFANITISILSVGVVFISQVWWISLLFIPSFIWILYLSFKGGGELYQKQRETTHAHRKANHLQSLLDQRNTVDERTLFQFGEPVNTYWYRIFEGARRQLLRTSWLWFWQVRRNGIGTLILILLMLAFLLYETIQGNVELSMFIALVSGSTQLHSSMTWGLSNFVNTYARHRELMKDLSIFANLEIEDGHLKERVALSNLEPFESLEFERVRFKYPNMEHWVLNDLSFKLNRGVHYAFIGINGAGKTTIMKLMTGLYDQYEGAIYLNGKDIRTIPKDQLKGYFSFAFQDFARYELTLEENIRIASFEHPSGVSNIDSILEKLQLTGFIAGLEHGLETPLGKLKENGQDLSGGEWQRIALARSFMFDSPIRILDEPTAALDPLQESELYRWFDEMSSEDTILFISHRLGSTKLADHIFVIDQGRLIEEGNHFQLMQQGGVYAEMFEAQRSWYLNEQDQPQTT